MNVEKIGYKRFISGQRRLTKILKMSNTGIPRRVSKCKVKEATNFRRILVNNLNGFK
jgi:hypothetical protein